MAESKKKEAVKEEEPVVAAQPVVQEKTAAEKEKEALSATFEVKEKKLKAFAAYKQVKEEYQEEQALNLLRKKIFQYKEIDQKFLKKIEENSAFKTEKIYLPIAQVEANVRYTWSTKVDKEKIEHTDVKKVMKLFSNGVESLDAVNVLTGGATTVKMKEDAALFEKNKYKFSTAAKEFKNAVKKEKPVKNAKVETCAEVYELIYVPVLKATCVFEGETYVGYINLVNGACISDYKTSERLNAATDKVMAQVKISRMQMVIALLFNFALWVMSFFKSWLPDWKWDPKYGVFSIIVGAIVIVPVLMLVWLAMFKADKMKGKAVQTGKMPTGTLANIAAIIGWAACVAAAVLFFFKIVIL